MWILVEVDEPHDVGKDELQRILIYDMTIDVESLFLDLHVVADGHAVHPATPPTKATKSPMCMGLDDTVPAGVSPLCEAKHTGLDAHKAIMCEREPSAWCSLRGIWVCQKCCQLCYEDMYPEGCMAAEDIWRTK